MIHEEEEFNRKDYEVSEYELLRRKNVEERNKFLESLGINDAVNEIISIKAAEDAKKRQIVKRPHEDLPKRERSRRLRGLGVKKNKPIKEQPVIDKRLRGTIELKTENESFDFNNLVGSERNFSFDPNLDLSTCDQESFRKNLSRLQMKEPRKVVPTQIQSICVHPTLSKQIVIAGCESGQVGLWDLNSGVEHDVVEFKYHQAPVNCISVSKFNQQKIYTTSHEGSVCCMDITQKKCSNVFSTYFFERIRQLTWHDELDANTFLISHGDGSVGVLDTREDRDKISWIKCFERSCKTVQVHPINSNFFLASGTGTVSCKIFDLRSKDSCLSEITHPKALKSAFFSPNGYHILTTCYDHVLRIFDASNFQEDIPTCKIRIPPQNFCKTSFQFKARWFPFRSDAFHIGATLSPRRIQIYDQSNGTLIYEIKNKEMVTISHVIDVHPHMLFIAGGTGSGKIHAFIPPDSSKEAVL